jgi:flagellar assembly factor FliW
MTTTVVPNRPLDLTRETPLRFVVGMPGLEQYTAYTLIGIDGVPVFWLRCDETDGLALPLADAFAVDPAYSFALSDADVATLALDRPEDTLVFVVLTVRRDGTITANLFAPVIVNRRSWRAKQVILDGSSYSLHHPVEGFGS